VPVLLAGRRLSDNPKGSFRAISGLILAISSPASRWHDSTIPPTTVRPSSAPASRTVTDQFAFTTNNSIPSVSQSVVESLRSIRGVKGVTIVYVAPANLRIDGRVPNINGLGGDLQDGLVSCAERLHAGARRCHAGATYAALGDDVAFMRVTRSVTVAASTTAECAAHDQRDETAVQLIAVATNGSTSVIEKVQTVLDRDFMFESTTSLFGEVDAKSSQLLNELRTSSEVVTSPVS